MSNQKNFYLAIKDTFDGRIPVLWCSAKTFYEENSEKHKEWNWSSPWIAMDYEIDDILEQCCQKPPDVFGCSVYVWNEHFMDDLSRRVKMQHPECLIVYGGPQPDIKYSNDFFKLHPWVDIVCPSDGYGEIIIKEILDHYPIQDFEDIPYIYYTNPQKEKILSKTGIAKRAFKWPANIYEAQEEILLPKISKMSRLVVIYETSRGCPYKCIYCDWGGGTYTKISKKPMDTVKKELEWLAKNRIDVISFADANFGIMEIDYKIAEHLVAIKENYDYPRVLHLEAAKNHLDRMIKINHLLASKDMLISNKIAIQTLNDDIKENIERVDIDFQLQVAAAQDLKSKYPRIPIKIETIQGLPGDTYQITLEQIDKLITAKLPASKTYAWVLLPESPAFSPEMREKFHIQTIKKSFSIAPIIYKKGVNPDPGVTSESEFVNVNMETVVSTYSYSKDEWIDMTLISCLAFAGESNGLNHLLIPYLLKEHNVSVVDVYDSVFKILFKEQTQISDQMLLADTEKLLHSLNGWMYDPDCLNNHIDYHPDFPLLLTPFMFTAFSILLNIQSFYKEICETLSVKYNDEKLIDLGHYLGQAVIDISYDPSVGRKFNTKYNWLDYFNGFELSEGSYVYVINDQTILVNHEADNPDLITWHLEPNDLTRKKQFYYQSVTRLSESRISSTIKLL